MSPIESRIAGSGGQKLAWHRRVRDHLNCATALVGTQPPRWPMFDTENGVVDYAVPEDEPVSFPIIIEHSEATGRVGDRTVHASTLGASALILISRGADQILVPVPSELEKERASQGAETLPTERRSIVKLIDSDGEILKRVRGYLEPLADQAVKWPESAFVGFLEDFVYYVALGVRHKSAIASDAAAVVRDFIPIIDPICFRGEAQFRLAEMASLICSYEPHCLDHGSLRAEADVGRELTPRLWDLLETAEFRLMVSETGKLGYLEHPVIAVRRLRNIIRDFLQRKDTSVLLKVVGTVADLASRAHTSAATVKTAAGVLSSLADIGAPFSPPFLKLGPAVQGIYRVALSGLCRDAIPPAGTIFAFRRYRAGRESYSWLSVGEELKLEREAGDIDGSMVRFKEAQSALARFL